MPQHVEDQFSAAFEGELDATAQARFDAHLANCAACTGNFQHFRETVEMVRSAPLSSMPRAVTLPDGPPVAERALWSPLAAFRGMRVRLRVGLATGAAALAAAVLVVAGLGSHNLSTASKAPSGQNAALIPGNAGAAPAAAATPAVQATGTAGPPFVTPPCAPMLLTSGSAQRPATFGNADTVSDASRPQQELTLAVSSTHVTSGADVLVYARLTVPATVAAAPSSTFAPSNTVYVPCVGLLNSGASTSQIDRAQPGGSVSSFATMSPDVHTSDGPLQRITIPAGLAPGTVVTVVAIVPAGAVGNSSAMQLVATVTVTVG